MKSFLSVCPWAATTLLAGVALICPAAAEPATAKVTKPKTPPAKKPADTTKTTILANEKAIASFGGARPPQEGCRRSIGFLGTGFQEVEPGTIKTSIYERLPEHRMKNSHAEEGFS